MTFSQLCIIINDYAQVFNRFNVCWPQVARLPVGHIPSIRISRVARRDTGGVLMAESLFAFRRQLLPRILESCIILAIEANRSQPLVLPLNRGFYHTSYSYVANDNEMLFFL